MGKRRLAREYCLQALYLADVGLMPPDEVRRALSAASEQEDGETLSFAHALLDGTLSRIQEIDSAIQEYAKNWKLSRMSAVDRCILRMSAYEIMFASDMPVAAAIDEAIELSKKYATDQSSRFINGVLDRIKEKRRSGQT